MINQVILEGRFYKDADNLRESSKGMKFISFGICIPQKKNEAPLFINCVAFDHTAEYVSKAGRKGNSFIINGALTPQINKDGKQSGVQVNVNNITIYPKRNATQTFEDFGDEVEEDNNYPW